MDTSQRSSTPIFTKTTSRHRWGSAVLIVGIGGMFLFLWATARGWVDPTSLIGVCGFQQRTGLPCLGCYWTRAGQSFVTGHILRSFYIQPAAAIFYLAAVFAVFFALLSCLFGIQFRFLKRFRSKRVYWILAAAGAGLVLAAWILEVVRTIRGIDFV